MSKHSPDDRRDAGIAWANNTLRQIGLAEADASWAALQADASMRRYFRGAVGDTTLLLMDCPASEGGLDTFIDIDQRLQAAGVRAPQLVASEPQAGYLLLEDFGDSLLRELLAPERGQQLLDSLVPTLTAMAQHCDSTDLPEFDGRKMQAELDLFTDWYVARHCQASLDAGESESWRALCALLIDAAKAQPQCFVHRDFHSCNLLLLADEAVGVIDFQDAVRGPVSYDLVSWLWDRYITWPRAQLEQWCEQLRPALAPSLPAQQWQQYCDWMALQRNLKIVGIFARLNYRDDKPNYLALLPRFAAYVLEVIPRYSELAFARPMLERLLVDTAASGSDGPGE